VPGALVRIARGLLGAWSVLAGVLLAVAVLLPIVDALVGPPPGASYSGALASIPYYVRQPWTARFVADQDEIGKSKVRYEPFVVWRRPSFSSTTVNVGPDRQRVVPGSDCATGAKKVWFFGGSTMWGTSSPDVATIPALFVAEMRARTGMPLCVRNFGESAWVSTQEVIALVRALERGEVPDLAVFYDGANDLHLTFLEGEPYGHFQLEAVRERFDRAERERAAEPKNRRSARELLRWFAPSLAAQLDLAWPVASPPSGQVARTPAELAAEAVRVLQVKREVVRAIASRFGFEAHFFWQPYLLAGRKPLAPGEERIMTIEGRDRPAFLSTVEHANALVENGSRPDETNLSRVFEGTSEQVYTDAVHVTPQGNEMVVRAMVEVLDGRLRR